MDYTFLYLGTFSMLSFCAILLYAIMKVTNTRKFMETRDRVYMEKFNGIEKLLTEDIKTILIILKDKI